MPWLLSLAAVASELATAPSILFLIFPSSSMKWFAVDPVPTPMMHPDGTCSIAALATACFISSCVINSCFIMGSTVRIAPDAKLHNAVKGLNSVLVAGGKRVIHFITFPIAIL